MTVTYDGKGNIFQKYDIRQPDSLNDHTTILLIDKDNYVVYKDKQYRAQGAHLKPLEYSICSLQGLSAINWRANSHVLISNSCNKNIPSP